MQVSPCCCSILIKSSLGFTSFRNNSLIAHCSFKVTADKGVTMLLFHFHCVTTHRLLLTAWYQNLLGNVAFLLRSLKCIGHLFHKMLSICCHTLKCSLCFQQYLLHNSEHMWGQKQFNKKKKFKKTTKRGSSR